MNFLVEAVFLTVDPRIDNNNKEIGAKTDLALIDMIDKLGKNDYAKIRDRKKVIKYNQYSFIRKRQSVVADLDIDKRRVYVIGDAEYVANSCIKLLNIKTEIIDISINEKSLICENITAMAELGLLTTAMAYKDIEKSDNYKSTDSNGFPNIEKFDFILVGIFGICDPPRLDVEKTIRDCRNSHIKIRMVTTENPVTALSIARHIGIANETSTAMLGQEFEHETGGLICENCRTTICDCPYNPEIIGHRVDVIKNLESFKKLIENLDILARAKPHDKYILVTGLKQLGKIVAVTGDAMYDAPALKKADVGFAMGNAGIELAREAADIILLDNNFNSIFKAAM